MPKAYAIVNPNRRDEPEDSPLRPLAGVAVAFAVCLKVKQVLAEQGVETPSLYPLLQFVATGTICDLAKLTPTNMKLVRHGLKQLPSSQYPGFRQFFSQEERKAPMAFSEKLSFNIGPMINSKGRLDHPEKALNLLIADDSDDAFDCYSHLEISNNERKFIQGGVFKEAKEQVINSIDGDELTCCIVYSPEWHEGVIGIVASKLVESFKVPAIVFTNAEQEGVMKASARSAGELDLFSALKAQEDYFIKFGGHKAAAGLSLNAENYAAFKNAFTASMKEIPAIERTKQFTYDLEVKAIELNPDLAKQLEMLEPYGMGNEKPIFKASDLILDSYDLLKEVHVRWNFSFTDAKGNSMRIKGISFNYVGKWDTPHPEELYQAQNHKDQPLNVYFTLGINRFKGNEYLQLMVEKIELA
jgi:single-stranded-DNA-specific exonuclease